jgi:phosphatidylglycerophosphatase A
LNKHIPARVVLGSPIHFIAFGFGSGLAPAAPGTVGTIVGIPFFLLMTSLSLASYLVLTLLLFLFGVWVCGQSSKMLGVHDHGGIVWDEIVGYLVTMVAAPPGWGWVAMGFMLFRIFDIFKPWPISYLDKHVSGGMGIMIDDVFAGIYALLVLQSLHYFWA